MESYVCPVHIFCFISCLLSSTKYASDVTQQYLHLEAFQINRWDFLWEIASELGSGSRSSTPCLVSRFTCLVWPPDCVCDSVPDRRATCCCPLEFILSQDLTGLGVAKWLLVMDSSSFPAWLQHGFESPNEHLAALCVFSNVQISLHWFTQGLKKPQHLFSQHLSETCSTEGSVLIWGTIQNIWDAVHIVHRKRGVTGGCLMWFTLKWQAWGQKT